MGLTHSPGASAQALDQITDIHIPAQRLADALIELGRQTGLQVMMAAADFDVLQSPGASGRMTAREALVALLRGTPLQFRQVGAQSVAIQRSEPPSQKAPAPQFAAPGASVAASAPDTTPAVSQRLRAAAAEIGVGSPQDEWQPTSSPPYQRLQEIIVTAEKFAVDVMHAPLSMSALNGATLQRDEIHQLQDLQFYVPGLSMSTGPLGVTINIRGIGLTFNSPNVAQGVPIYRDGLLVPTGIGDEPLWDVANVQVLRGPQGTLVGANSTGGAMFINTVNPTVGGNFSGYAQADGGSYHHLRAQSAANLPITDWLAARVGAYIERRSSFSRNLTAQTAAGSAGGLPEPTRRDEPGDLNMLAWRTSLLFQPTERIQVLGKIEYFHNDTGYVAEKPITIASTAVDGVTTNCPAAGSYVLADPSSWSTVPPACGYAAFAPAQPYQIAYATAEPSLDEQIWRESLEAKLPLSARGPTLRLLMGGSYNTQRFVNENTASAYYTGGSSTTTHEHTLTYEADVLGPADNALQWVLGGFWWVDPSQFVYSPVNFSGGAFGVGPGYSQPVSGLYLNGSNSRKSYAGFGDLTYQLDARWKLEAGLRQTWNRNSNPFSPCASNGNTSECIDGDANAFHYLHVNPTNPWGPLLISNNGFPNLGEEQDQFMTWKVALDYNLGAQSFLYAEAATGGKAGGIRTNALGDNFQPEKDADFELGWKLTMAGRAQLQLDAFYTDYTNMQIRAADIHSGQASIYNAGVSKVYGLELSGQAAWSGWLMAAATSYVRSRFSIGDIVNQDVCNLYTPCRIANAGQCPPGVASGDLGNGMTCFNFQSGGLYVDGRFYPWLENVNGLQLPNSPRFQGNVSVAYRWQAAPAVTIIPRVDLSYQSRQYSQIYDTPLDDYTRRSNLNFKLSLEHNYWLIEGYVTNVTGTIYPIAQSDQNAEILDAPRQYGLRLTRDF